jgi:hypothetical protein
MNVKIDKNLYLQIYTDYSMPGHRLPHANANMNVSVVSYRHEEIREPVYFSRGGGIEGREGTYATSTNLINDANMILNNINYNSFKYVY